MFSLSIKVINQRLAAQDKQIREQQERIAEIEKDIEQLRRIIRNAFLDGSE